MSVALNLACSNRDRPAPDVLGIRFAVPLATVRPYIGEGTKAEPYPLIPDGGMYGYTLTYPNPENWTVIVQDEAADDLDSPAIFRIFISRRLGHSCSRTDTNELTRTLEVKYRPLFSASYVQSLEDLDGFAFRGTSDKQLLQILVCCDADRVCAGFKYLDLDRYRYHDPEAVRKVISSAQAEAKDYKARTF